jgi:hypothetical protein
MKEQEIKEADSFTNRLPQTHARGKAERIPAGAPLAYVPVKAGTDG